MSSLKEEEGSLGRLRSSAFLVSSLEEKKGVQVVFNGKGRLRAWVRGPVKVGRFLKGTLKAKVNIQIWGPYLCLWTYVVLVCPSVVELELAHTHPVHDLSNY